MPRQWGLHGGQMPAKFLMGYVFSHNVLLIRVNHKIWPTRNDGWIIVWSHKPRWLPYLSPSYAEAFIYLVVIFFFLLSWNVDATLLLHFLIIFPHCNPTDRNVWGIADMCMPISFICTVPNNTQWVILVLCCKVERAFHSLSTSALEVRLFWSLQSKTGTGGTSRYFQRHFALRSSPNNWKACYGIVSQPGVREKREKSETLIRIKLDSSWL